MQRYASPRPSAGIVVVDIDTLVNFAAMRGSYAGARHTDEKYIRFIVDALILGSKARHL